jgi:DNA-binding NtrC family response regulator
MSREDPMSSTARGSQLTPAPAQRPRFGWILSIALHPDASRVGQRVLVGPGSFELGTSSAHFGEGNAFDLKYVSARHCVFRLSDGRVSLTDLSTNGTTVNGAPIAKHEPVELRSGDVLNVGPALLLLRHTGLCDDAALREAPPPWSRDRGEDLAEKARLLFVGQSYELRSALAQMRAAGDAPALIRGETGTGKELAAEALHVLSGRKQRLVRVNCGTLSHQLSQLFGHVKGAFTNANRDHKGHFEEADGGTLFLDELPELTPDVQVQLLRVLDSGVLRPLGAQRDVKVDVRVVAATHADLEARVRDGRLREDLYFRLKGAEVRLPPLRERIDDVPLLFFHFARMEGALRANVSRTLMTALLRHDFPGNVRELRQAVKQVVAAARAREGAGDDQLRLTEILHEQLGAPAAGSRSRARLGSAAGRRHGEAPKPSPEDLQRCLRENGGCKRRTAPLLGVARSTLYRWLARDKEDTR